MRDGILNYIIKNYLLDEVGNIQKIENPDGGEMTFVYDLQGNLKSVADPEENTFFFDYDFDGNLIVETDARNYSIDPNSGIVTLGMPRIQYQKDVDEKTLDTFSWSSFS